MSLLPWENWELLYPGDEQGWGKEGQGVYVCVLGDLVVLGGVPMLPYKYGEHSQTLRQGQASRRGAMHMEQCTGMIASTGVAPACPMLGLGAEPARHPVYPQHMGLGAGCWQRGEGAAQPLARVGASFPSSRTMHW